jgi:hypothetical protein
VHNGSLMRRHLPTLASLVNLIAALAAGLLVASIGYLLVQHQHSDYIAWRIKSGYETADSAWVREELAKIGVGERRVALTGALTIAFLAASAVLVAVQQRLPPAETPLRRALAETGNLPRRPPWILGWPLRLAGFVLMAVLGVGAFAVLMAVISAAQEEGFEIETTAGGLAIVALVALLPAAVFLGPTLLRHGKRIVRARAAAAAADDPHPPVLYLRSFADEETRQHGFEEEELANVVGRIGPVVAVGRPGERLPPLGAVRFYIEDDEWRSRVSALIAEAQVVIVRAGAGEGLAWEVEQAIGTLAPGRLVILLAQAPAGYEGFRARTAGLLPRPLPPVEFADDAGEGIWGIARFRSDWTPELAFFETGALRVALLRSLRSLAQGLGVPRRRWTRFQPADAARWLAWTATWVVVVLVFSQYLTLSCLV